MLLFRIDTRAGQRGQRSSSNMHAHTISQPDAQDLSTLAKTIRDEHRAVQAAGGALLHHAMNAGDGLIVAQEKVSGTWKSWLNEHCLLSVHTALVYQRLARHREQIEAEVERAGDLSLRAALRLTAKPKGEAKEAAKNQTTLLNFWKRASDSERTALLDHVGVDGIRKAASLDLFRKLRERARVDQAESDPNATLTSLLRKALSLISTADAPETSASVAASNVAEAAGSLRCLLKKLNANNHDLHDIEVGIATARAKRRRAA
jgi:hypothetical protein